MSGHLQKHHEERDLGDNVPNSGVWGNPQLLSIDPRRVAQSPNYPTRFPRFPLPTHPIYAATRSLSPTSTTLPPLLLLRLLLMALDKLHVLSCMLLISYSILFAHSKGPKPRNIFRQYHTSIGFAEYRGHAIVTLRERQTRGFGTT